MRYQPNSRRATVATSKGWGTLGVTSSVMRANTYIINKIIRYKVNYVDDY